MNTYCAFVMYVKKVFTDINIEQFVNFVSVVKFLIRNSKQTIVKTQD